MRLINLLPKDNQKDVRLDQASKVFLEFWIWVGISLMVLLALTFFAIFTLKANIQETKSKMLESQTTLDSSDFKDLQIQITNINKQAKEITVIKDQHLYWSKAILALAEIIPPDVQLNTLVINRDTGKTDITGQAQRRESVILIWSNILKNDMFKNINFPLPNLEKATLSDFTYTFYIDKEQITQP